MGDSLCKGVAGRLVTPFQGVAPSIHDRQSTSPSSLRRRSGPPANSRHIAHFALRRTAIPNNPFPRVVREEAVFPIFWTLGIVRPMSEKGGDGLARFPTLSFPPNPTRADKESPDMKRAIFSVLTVIALAGLTGCVAHHRPRPASCVGGCCATGSECCLRRRRAARRAEPLATTLRLADRNTCANCSPNDSANRAANRANGTSSPSPRLDLRPAPSRILITRFAARGIFSRRIHRASARDVDVAVELPHLRRFEAQGRRQLRQCRGLRRPWRPMPRR